MPVAARETVARLKDQVDQLICLSLPPDFRAVGEWYEDFDQATDRHVVELLERAGALRPAQGTA